MCGMNLIDTRIFHDLPLGKPRSIIAKREFLPVRSALFPMVLALALLGPASAFGQFKSRITDPAPGFGIVYGEGMTEHEGETRRFGFTTRRLKDELRVGSLALLYEEYEDGLDFVLQDHDLSKDDVELRYQSIFVELKRYFPFGGPAWYYWGIRAGYTRVQGKIRPADRESRRKFTAVSAAPLALLALPFILEHPGFILIAAVDGTSLGAIVDIAPERVWLDFQISATVLPRHRDRSLILEDLLIVTQTLQLVIAF